jgi:hypothetical protein
MEHMGMDLSRGDNVDPPAAPEQVDGRATVNRATVDPAEETDGESSEPPAAEPIAEFWDACWTLEDEYVPRAIVAPEHHPRVRRKHLPDVIVLL